MARKRRDAHPAMQRLVRWWSLKMRTYRLKMQKTHRGPRRIWHSLNTMGTR